MRTMGLIFTSIHERNVPELTAARSIASVPFGGRYRLIDFLLSDMVAANVSTVGIITKYNFQSLMDHVGSGKNWDLARKNGGIVFLPPYGGDSRMLYTSRLDAIKSVLIFLKNCTEDIIIMSDCDFAWAFNMSKAVDYFVEKNSDITVIYREKVPDGDEIKHRNAIVTDKNMNVVDIVPAQRNNGANKLMTNMLIMRRDFLIKLIERCAAVGMKSFSRDVLPFAIREYRVSAYGIDGFFASIESLQAYFRYSMQLTDKTVRDSLFKSVEVYTKVRDSVPCRMGDGAHVNNSIVADGCVIEGTVENSILFRGVRIGKGAVIKNSVIFQDADIGERCKLGYCIADKKTVIKPGKNLSGCETLPYFIPKDTVL